MRALGLALALIVLPLAAPAGDIVIGLGYTDFSDDGANDSPVIELELHSDPLWQFGGGNWSLGTALTADGEGDFFVGAGPSVLWPLRNRWFVEASVMPGYYDAAEADNSLGGHFQIRSLIGVGRAVSDRVAVSVAFSHKSNAGTDDHNPGGNAITLRTRWSF